MNRIDAIIIGGGQAGLAMSACLTRKGIAHVVIERGRIAERWFSERWDSLKLLTPNWMTRLPGASYAGPDPNGFMTGLQVAGLLKDYANRIAAPVREETAVVSVEGHDDGYRVVTNQGTWLAHVVIIATGYCDLPHLPSTAKGLSANVLQLHSSQYGNAKALPAGKILVAGASSSGVQIAHELVQEGRDVMLAVGRHVRVPRRYRGRDIMWWMDRAGVLDDRAPDLQALDQARIQPSLQLAGREDGQSIDLALLQRLGVKLVGRVMAAERHHVRFGADLDQTIAAADHKLRRLFDRIDQFAGPSVPPAEPFQTISVPLTPGLIDLAADRVSAIVWATGYRRDYNWLRVPVIDPRGEIVHSGGILPAPGLYALGLHFMRRRKSAFIDGVGRDAEELAIHIAAYLDRKVGKARTASCRTGAKPIKKANMARSLENTTEHEAGCVPW